MLRLSVAVIGLFVSNSISVAQPVTFTRDIAPIMFKHCVICHRPGEIGPFSLLTYQDVKKRASLIVEVTKSRLMPPWKPQPGHGEFVDERRLSDAQIARLQAWVNDGCIEGDWVALPPVPRFPVGWRLGKPDVILKMPKPFTIPAEGADIYQHFVFPLNLKTEKYLRGVEVRPSNPKVAHHAIGLLDNSGTARKLASKDPNNGYPGLGGPGFIPVGLTPGYVPGHSPRFFPKDVALTLKPGMDLVLQMHYHPIGKVETDQTMIGLYFTDKKPLRNPFGFLLGSEDIDIPAGAKSHTITDEFKLPCDLEVTDIWAHMHMIGRETHVWAELPDGQRLELLKITDWDFAWQDVYRYKKPFRLPKHTVIHARFVYDNSSDNPRNPSKPPKRVRHGEGSTDEMAGIWVGGLADHWADEIALAAANVAHFIEMTTKARLNRKP